MIKNEAELKKKEKKVEAKIFEKKERKGKNDRIEDTKID